VSFASILSVRRPIDDPPRERERRRLAAEVLDGQRWLWERPFVRALALWLAAGGIAFSSIGLVILVAARERGATSGEIGVLFALTSGGAFLGSLATPRLMRVVSAPRLIAAFAWSVALATLLLVPTHSPYVLGLLGAFAFFLAPTVNAILFSTIAAEAPDRMQGRVNSAAIQLVSLLAPIGPLAGGLLIEALDPSRTLLVYDALFVVLAVVATVARPLRAGPPRPRSRA
jgi:predicted MFS family arabinose efflux permease